MPVGANDRTVQHRIGVKMHRAVAEGDIGVVSGEDRFAVLCRQNCATGERKSEDEEREFHAGTEFSF